MARSLYECGKEYWRGFRNKEEDFHINELQGRIDQDRGLARSPAKKRGVSTPVWMVPPISPTPTTTTKGDHAKVATQTTTKVGSQKHHQETLDHHNHSWKREKTTFRK